MAHQPLANSVRNAKPGFRAVRAADPDQVIDVTLVLNTQSISDEDVIAFSTKLPEQRDYLTHAQLAEQHGAPPEAFDKVHAFAHEYGLTVVKESPLTGTIVLRGTVAGFQQAFEVDLHVFESEDRRHSYRGRTGAVHVPDDLGDVVRSVHGLDNREQAHCHFRITAGAISPHAAESGLAPQAVARAYEFPSGTAKGQTISIIELGGGYRTSDLKSYFGAHAPRVKAVGVDSATNKPTGDPGSADGEVELDIEVSGAIARGATIKVFFAPNTDKGFLDAINAAIEDTSTSVISISWGGAESSWTKQSLDAFNAAFKRAAMLGITVLVAAGDDGVRDRVNDGKRHVDFPSSSPFATACGGTRLTLKHTTVSSEVTWGGAGEQDGATGGGFSTHFARPSYQDVKLGGKRGVPDVAGNADPSTGYAVLVDGQRFPIGGTSAVAPLYAALVAVLNGIIGKRCGFLNPILYANPKVARDITQGTNALTPGGDGFSAAPGWDATTGLGVIIGTSLQTVLSGKSAS